MPFIEGVGFMWSMCRVQQYQALVRVREQKRPSTSVPSLHRSIGVRCTCQTSKTATGNSLSLSHAVYYCVEYSSLSSTFLNRICIDCRSTTLPTFPIYLPSHIQDVQARISNIFFTGCDQQARPLSPTIHTSRPSPLICPDVTP